MQSFLLVWGVWTTNLERRSYPLRLPLAPCSKPCGMLKAPCTPSNTDAPHVARADGVGGAMVDVVENSHSTPACSGVVARELSAGERDGREYPSTCLPQATSCLDLVWLLLHLLPPLHYGRRRSATTPTLLTWQTCVVEYCLMPKVTALSLPPRDGAPRREESHSIITCNRDRFKARHQPPAEPSPATPVYLKVFTWTSAGQSLQLSHAPDFLHRGVEQPCSPETFRVVFLALSVTRHAPKASVNPPTASLCG